VPKTNNIPHVLIAADPIFALQLWELCPRDRKPFLLSTNPSAIYNLCRRKPRKPDVIGCSFFGLIERLVQGGNDDAAVDELRSSLVEVRRSCDLDETTRLRVAMVGSHSSLSGTIDGGNFHQGQYAGLAGRPGFQNAMRRGRTLVGLFDKAIAELDEFEPLWLADAFPKLRPHPADGCYPQIVRDARAMLKTMPMPPVSVGNIQIHKPAIPMIYVTRDPVAVGSAPSLAAKWRLLDPSPRTHSYSVTQLLIDQFREQREQDPSLRGVLVKLLPEDISDQNVLDAPIVGEETIETARSAGLEAILLDAKRGILRPPVARDRITHALVLGV
jgi:hypothetical protein